MRGIVQGVGFRPWVYRLAGSRPDRPRVEPRVRRHDRGVRSGRGPRGLRAGAARHAPSGRTHRADRARRPCTASKHPRSSRSPAARPPASGEVSIPPDLATCPECLAEVAGPGARRYRYPFTNCTNCGPRFTIAARRSLRPAQRRPWRRFAMCEACRAEYESPLDRRFHAQPIACPRCGPRLRFARRDWRVDRRQRPPRRGGDACWRGPGRRRQGARRVPARLRRHVRRGGRAAATAEAPRGEALRGDGGDARGGRAAGRARRGRAGAARRAEAPIVLCRARPGNGLAPDVAPDTPLVGVFLAYTPLHRLLVDAVGRPLVMTSGNLSEEPLAYRDADAVARLGRPSPTCCSTHDREIAAPCDDSVARVIAGAPVDLPAGSRVRAARDRAAAGRWPRPVLACGALLKNTFCLAVGDRAWLGPHVGDLDNLATTIAFFEEAVARLERFTRIDTGGVRARPAPRPPLDALRAGARRRSTPSPCSTTTRTSAP